MRSAILPFQDVCWGTLSQANVQNLYCMGYISFWLQIQYTQYDTVNAVWLGQLQELARVEQY